MAKRFKIHPGIGFARVGPSEQGFFIDGERLGDPPFELNGNGEAVEFTGYKDASFLIRRQAARFRVYEYDVDDASHVETFVGEVSATDGARIEWSVKLVNSKASGPLMRASAPGSGGFDGERVVLPHPSRFRNPDSSLPAGFTRDDLKASVELSVNGVNQAPARTTGTIAGNSIFLGEVRTDAEGRLVVLGGEGRSGSWLNPAPSLNSFLNNTGWFDDVADGPVDARVTLADGTSFDAVGAWVVVGSPDFAPHVTPIITLYDVAANAMHNKGTQAIPNPLSYQEDIKPFVQRAADLYWVNSASAWSDVRELLADEGDNLRDPTSGADDLRDDGFEAIIAAETDLSQFRFPPMQRKILEMWRDGDFVPGPVARPAETEVQLLDRVSLTAGIGGGFFPGIEAGFLLTEPSVYSEFGRVTRGKFTDHDGTVRDFEPGILTQRMALPWQADFNDCNGDWWPAQRPDLARFDEDGNTNTDSFGNDVGHRWTRGVSAENNTPVERASMVEEVARLGVIVETDIGGELVQAESGRDPALDTGA